MKKNIYVLLAVAFILVMFCSNLNAQQEEGMSFSLNGGVVTDDSFSFDPFLWTAGIIMDFHLGDYLMLSPECFIIVYKFEFDPLWLAPAVIANIKLQSFFVGAGITKWFIIGDGYNASTDFALKINAGLRSGGIRLTAFIVTPFDGMFSHMTIGATIGFGN